VKRKLLVLTVSLVLLVLCSPRLAEAQTGCWVCVPISPPIGSGAACSSAGNDSWGSLSCSESGSYYRFCTAGGHACYSIRVWGDEGGGWGGGGGTGCTRQPGSGCPASCMSCTYY
jgi:hypothetical protein